MKPITVTTSATLTATSSTTIVDLRTQTMTSFLTSTFSTTIFITSTATQTSTETIPTTIVDVQAQKTTITATETLSTTSTATVSMTTIQIQPTTTTTTEIKSTSITTTETEIQVQSTTTTATATETLSITTTSTTTATTTSRTTRTVTTPSANPACLYGYNLIHDSTFELPPTDLTFNQWTPTTAGDAIFARIKPAKPYTAASEDHLLRFSTSNREKAWLHTPIQLCPSKRYYFSLFAKRPLPNDPGGAGGSTAGFIRTEVFVQAGTLAEAKVLEKEWYSSEYWTSLYGWYEAPAGSYANGVLRIAVSWVADGSAGSGMLWIDDVFMSIQEF